MRGSEQNSFAQCRCAEIRQLNDQMRLNPGAGRIVVTRGVAALGPAALLDVMHALRNYDRFDEGNDPWGEHDMGDFEVAGEAMLWKIDYYDLRHEYASPDPSDPAVTMRVLTIMLVEEY